MVMRDLQALRDSLKDLMTGLHRVEMDQPSEQTSVSI